MVDSSTAWSLTFGLVPEGIFMEVSYCHREGIVQGLVVIAVTLAQMGTTESDVWVQIVGVLVTMQIDQQDVVPILRLA